MKRLMHWQHAVAALFVLSLVTSACATGSTMPAAGQYSVQRNSVQFDGERYQLAYADASGAVQRLETRNLKMVRDDTRTYLEVPTSGDPVLHMREDEPIAVQGRDQNGAFSSPWFPFLLGTMVGNAMGGFGSPSYRYPPTDTFSRNEQLRGSVPSTRPELPDYSKVAASPNATTGQGAGTGGGVAATNKAPVVGTGAATSKGGFAKGAQSFESRQPSAPKLGKPSSGLSGSKGIGGARSARGRR